MSLSGQQLYRISDAIRAAYTPETLAQMVRGRLDVRLYDVAGGEDFRAQVFHLVEWAERQGRLRELLQAAEAENPGNEGLAEVAATLGHPAPEREAWAVAPSPWYLPFERNPAFFGRAEDLERLHKALTPCSGASGHAPVGIRPAGVTGMGGLGKTQLAVEYAYRYRAEYPRGVFWLNAAGDWRAEFAGLGVYLDPSYAGEGQEAQMRAAADYLQAHANCLLVLDNVEEPQQLRQPITRFLLPSALPCAVLFTTRRHDLGDFRPVELPVLPEGPGLQLLLRHASRQTIIAEEHPEHAEAVRIYAMLGGLPLALEIAGAHLGRRPAASLRSYREELLRRGALAVVDDRLGSVRKEELGTRHAAAVAATLAEQWEGLGEDARLLLHAAGQLSEAAAIPLARLGLLAGLSDGGSDFFGAPLADAAHELMDASLLEDLRGDLVRLHPLVRAFAAQQMTEAEREGFCWECAARLIVSYDNLAVLEVQCARRGIDAVEQDLLMGLRLLADARASDPFGASASLLLRAVRQESHTLRGWNAEQEPALFREQWLKRSMLLGERQWINRARSFLKALSCSHLEVVWTTGQSDMSLVRTLSGHTGIVWRVVVTPDGRQIVSSSSDKMLRVWDLASGETVRILSGRTGLAVAVTPDGRRVVSDSDDTTLRVWHLAGGESMLTLSGHTKFVSAVAVTPDGRYAVSGSDDKTLRVWDLTSGESMFILSGHTDLVWTVTVTPDGRYAVSGSYDKTLRVWDLTSGETVHTLSGHTDAVSAVAVTPDGRYAVSGSNDNTLRVWDLTSGRTTRTLRGHKHWVNAVAVTPDGRYAVSGSEDETMRVWDLASGETARILSGYTNMVWAVAVTPDGRYAVSGSDDATLRVWDLASGETVHTYSRHDGGVSAVAVTPDGRQAVSGSSDTTLRVWDLLSGESMFILSGHTEYVSAVAVTPDGRYAVSGSYDKTLRVWDLTSGRTVRSYRRHGSSVKAVAVTPDGRCAVSGSNDHTLRVWKLTSGRTTRTLRGHWHWVSAVAVTPDGRYAVSGSYDKTLRVWDLTSGETVYTLSGHTGTVSAVAVTPDGRYAVSGSHDKTLRVRELASGETVRILSGHDDGVNAVAVTPDGRYAVSGSDDKTLRVWDLPAGRETAHIVLDTAVQSIVTTPNGGTFQTGDRFGNLWCLYYRELPD